MDQIMVDVTHLATPPVPGDEAVLLGPSGDELIPASELAEKSGTIAWEIFTSIRARQA
jgi:alanine racemase